MSDTPRTDAEVSSVSECLGRYDYDRLAELARVLERELAEARKGEDRERRKRMGAFAKLTLERDDLLGKLAFNEKGYQLVQSQKLDADRRAEAAEKAMVALERELNEAEAEIRALTR